MKILVVDDSNVFRKILIELFARAGFDDVVEAGDFDEAIDVFRASKPNFTFVDMILPGRSGVELTKELLSIDGNAVVIAMSSIINKRMIQQSLEAGAKDFVLKPTNEIALNSVLTMWSG
ncbi:MAG: response regulator [Nitrospirota bacterium]